MFSNIESALADRVPQPANDPLPAPPDSETAALLRGFLTPILEQARSWDELTTGLSRKGYGIAFRAGHLVLLRLDTGAAICTGRFLGVPLRALSDRLGRPCIKVHRGGLSGSLA